MNIVFLKLAKFFKPVLGSTIIWLLSIVTLNNINEIDEAKSSISASGLKNWVIKAATDKTYTENNAKSSLNLKALINLISHNKPIITYINDNP